MQYSKFIPLALSALITVLPVKTNSVTIVDGEPIYVKHGSEEFLNTDGDSTYTVQPGDNWTKIRKRVGSERIWERMWYYNQGMPGVDEDQNRLLAGYRIKLLPIDVVEQRLEDHDRCGISPFYNPKNEVANNFEISQLKLWF